jgi:choline dehydrogenase-like flavoprotein
MIIDSRTLPDDETINTDVCIVGAGTAGITLAREFIDQKFRVCVMESGGLKPDKETQSLCKGENIGHPYFSLETARTRCFGGSTTRWQIEIDDNCFGARMRPLDAIDFEVRDWVPHSGWPFRKDHLDPFYERAQAICRIEPSSFPVQDWEKITKTKRLSFNGDQLKTVIFKFGARDPFIKDYIQQIAHAPNIATYLYANVINIETDETGRTVKRLQVACLPGNRFWVSAKIFILAAGAIEIPRILLLSNRCLNRGLGNQNDLVGRFFMEHLHFNLGLLVPSDQNIFRNTPLYNTIHMVNGAPIRAKLSLSEDVLRSKKLLNHVAQLDPMIMLYQSLTDLFYPNISSDSVRSLIDIHSAIFRGGRVNNPVLHLKNISNGLDEVVITIFRAIKRRILGIFNKKRIKLYSLENMSEQVPNPDSRITLSSDKDRLGMNRIRLDWRLSPIDIESAVRTLQVLDQGFQRAGIGRLYIRLKDETPPMPIGGGWHHMGTTRMHVDAKKGVVDENSRIHGMSNLYVAGPSIFPTGGYANPSLTIVALAVRLADHIKKLMKIVN